jgi:hypothetical protein
LMTKLDSFLGTCCSCLLHYNSLCSCNLLTTWGEQVASQLLEAKADVRAKARDGKTAVDAAVSQGRFEFPSHVCDWCSQRAHSLRALLMRIWLRLISSVSVFRIQIMVHALIFFSFYDSFLYAAILCIPGHLEVAQLLLNHSSR